MNSKELDSLKISKYKLRYSGEQTVKHLSEKIPFFPSLYPEELFYSVLARCSRYLGHPSAQRLNRVFFGTNHRQPYVDLVRKIPVLTSKLPNSSVFLAETILFNHTTFPYYAPFMETDKRTAINQSKESIFKIERMREIYGYRWLHTDKTLRFCPVCVKLMRSSYGELYWRRDHQIPTVLLCPDHGAVLLRADTSKVDTQEWCLAGNATCPDDAEPIVTLLSEKQRNTLLEISIASRNLLQSKNHFLTRYTESEAYQKLLADKGLNRRVKSGDPSKLQKELLAHFAHLAPIWPAMFESTKEEGAKYTNLKPGSGGIITDPIWYVLTNILFNESPDVQPAFGNGPWLCPNPTIQHSSPMPITKISRRMIAGFTTVALFTCECGYVYARSETKDGRQTKPRLRRFGPTLKPFLLRAKAKDWSVTRTAIEAGLDVKALRSAAATEGIIDDWLQPAVFIRCDKH